MLKPIARLVVRDDGTSDEEGGLMLGLALKNNGFFQKGHVYTVMEVLGEIVIRDEGPSVIVKAGDPKVTHSSWGNDVSAILSVEGHRVWLTREEFEADCKEKNKDG